MALPTDRLRWTPVTSDGSPGGFHYLVYRSTTPITDVDVLAPYASNVTSTTTYLDFLHTGTSWYFAVIAEDFAGNRSVARLLETQAGQVDVIMIIDNSGSMDATILSHGIDASQELLKRLQPGDRLGIRSIEAGAGEQIMPLTVMDNAGLVGAAQVLESYRVPLNMSPMDQALIWAQQQFSQPGVLNDGRPHILVIFSDGYYEEELLQPVLATLNFFNVSVFLVTTPGGLDEVMQKIVDSAPGTQPQSQMFDTPDLGDVAASIHQSFREIGNAIRGQVSFDTRGNVPPGQTRSVDFQVDRSMHLVTIHIEWDTSRPTPILELESPRGISYTPNTSGAAGLTAVSAPGEASFTLQLPPLAPGTWTLRITNPGIAPDRREQAVLPFSLYLPLAVGQDGGQRPALALDEPAADEVAFTLGVFSSSSIETTARLTGALVLESTVLEYGRPLTTTTVVWAVLEDQQGITQTVILHDDGLHNDGAAGDGRHAVSLQELVAPGLYHVGFTFRHYSPERGFLERSFERDLYIYDHELSFTELEWYDIEGDHDGLAEPGETIAVKSVVRNSGSTNEWALTSTLRLLSGSAELVEEVSAYPLLYPGISGANLMLFTFTVGQEAQPGSMLTFEQNITGQQGYRVSRTIEVPIGQPSFTGVKRYEEDSLALRYNGVQGELAGGHWYIAQDQRTSGAGAAESWVAGDTVAHTFRGSWVHIGYLRGPYGGKATVSIDGVSYALDTYHHVDDVGSVAYAIPGAPDQLHTVTIAVLGEQHANSAGAKIEIDYIDVWDGSPLPGGSFEELDARIYPSGFDLESHSSASAALCC